MKITEDLRIRIQDHHKAGSPESTTFVLRPDGSLGWKRHVKVLADGDVEEYEPNWLTEEQLADAYAKAFPDGTLHDDEPTVRGVGQSKSTQEWAARVFEAIRTDAPTDESLAAIDDARHNIPQETEYLRLILDQIDRAVAAEKLMTDELVQMHLDLRDAVTLLSEVLSQADITVETEVTK